MTNKKKLDFLKSIDGALQTIYHMGQFPQDENWLWVMSFKKKLELAVTKREEEPLFFQPFMRDFFSFITRKKIKVILTPLHYTTPHWSTLHYSSVVYKSKLQCSVVLCSGVRVTWICFLVMKLKRSHINSWKQGLLFTFGHSKFQNFFFERT